MTTPIQTAAAVLAKAAAFDQSFVRPDPLVVQAWAEAIGDLPPQDCLDVVTRHYVTSDRRLMPVNVIDGVRRIRRERLDAATIPAPAVDPDDVQAWLAADRANRAAIAEGREPLTIPTNDYRDRPVSQLLAAVLRDRPRVLEAAERLGRPPRPRRQFIPEPGCPEPRTVPVGDVPTGADSPVVNP